MGKSPVCRLYPETGRAPAEFTEGHLARLALATLRWKCLPVRAPNRPPTRAPARLPAATTTRAIRPPVVRFPGVTGIRGKLFSLLSTSYWLPARAARIATTAAVKTAHSHTARPCL